MTAASVLLDAQVQTKRMYSLLNEVMDLSRQLAEALDRNDQVTVQMVISMREEPIKRLRAAQSALEEQRNSLDPEAGKRLEALASQVAINRRLLTQVLELDRVLNKKVTREKSIYQ